MLECIFMNIIFKIMIISFFLNPTNIFAIELFTKIKDENKNIFKTLTRKSLSKEETKEFLYNYIIIINDERGDGLVTYYFDNGFYKRYKDLELISKDRWSFSAAGYIKLFYNKDKETWKIQPAKQNTINIKKKLELIGKLYEFSYKNKTDFYLKLESKKLTLPK